MDFFETFGNTSKPDKILEKIFSPAKAALYGSLAAQNYGAGFLRYVNEFFIPAMIASSYITRAENMRAFKSHYDTFFSYMDLMGFNFDLAQKSFASSMDVFNDYMTKEAPKLAFAMFNTFLGLDGQDLEDYAKKHVKNAELVSKIYPETIKNIEPEFGFHFERGIDKKVAETDRFILYQIMPTKKSIKVKKSGKPVLIIPPFVLGANILAFLPGEDKSYTHCFANQGIPTYIRIMKDIKTTPALQIMTGEDDALDTKYFCETIKSRHGRPVTINGYCQGGYSAVCDILSGKLDGLVDALITCVSPMDGTRDKGLGNFLKSLPKRFNDLIYGTKILPNGNKVADGLLMGWVYKLKSIDSESPLVAFFRDLALVTPKDENKPVNISKTAAALNYWLQNERNDLPLAITEMSFASYNIPISNDGTLPVKLFGKKLNFRRIKEKNIKWLICYGTSDDLVEKDTALAPLDYVDAEVSAFPKGHVAIATSWSNPRSACALHTVFGKEKFRGPVKFQLDLDAAAKKEK